MESTGLSPLPYGVPSFISIVVVTKSDDKKREICASSRRFHKFRVIVGQECFANLNKL